MFSKPIPVIDLFAGPGGLAEGFASVRSLKGTEQFRIALSIEKDPAAHRTLELRSFARSFMGKLPDAYYDYVRGRCSVMNSFPIEDFATMLITLSSRLAA